MSKEQNAARGPFDYPVCRHTRRHSPPVVRRRKPDSDPKSAYAPYKLYLRDEFRFTCVYCLRREGWGLGRGYFHTDHWEPQHGGGPDVHAYGNLLYACGDCNRAKADAPPGTIPHPEEEPYGQFLEIGEDGCIVARKGKDGQPCKEGKALMDQLHLNRTVYSNVHRLYRGLFNGYCHLKAVGDSEEEKRLMGDLEELFGVPRDEEAKLSGKRGAVRPYAARENMPRWF